MRSCNYEELVCYVATFYALWRARISFMTADLKQIANLQNDFVLAACVCGRLNLNYKLAMWKVKWSYTGKILR